MTTAPIFLCPGQGAQAVGMGRAWHDASPAAAEVFAEADQILGDSLGAPLSRLCFDGPVEVLNTTRASQPALYTAAVASHRALIEASTDTAENLRAPAATAGLSLGEYTALHLAGALSFADGLRLVALRGQAMQDAADANPSSMVALIGADEDRARFVCDQARGEGILVCANFNAPGQVVLSGDLEACDRALAAAEAAGLRATKLAVAGAFHSPLMADAADRLREALASTTITDPACPVLSNVTAQPHTTPDEIRSRLAAQLTQPVRWADCCKWLIAHVPGEMHELAPGKTLAGLMRRIDRAAKVTTHDTP